MTTSVPRKIFKPTEDWEKPDAVVYLSHDWKDTSDIKENPNLRGLKHILSACRAEGGVRLIFASSVSARATALNRYGRMKWQMEGLLCPPNEFAARIGLVYGGIPRGQWQTLCTITDRSIIPMLNPWKCVQPIHVDDVASGLLKLCALREPDRKVYGLASPQPIKFGQFLRLTSRVIHKRSAIVCPMPSIFVIPIMKFLAFIPGVPTPDRERVLGLVGLPIIKTRSDLGAIGLSLRPLAKGLSGSSPNWRSAALREAWVHIAYVSQCRPGLGELRQYVKHIEAEIGPGIPRRYPPIFLRLPWLLRLIDPPFGSGQLQQRLNTAFRIAESQGTLSKKIYNYEGDGRLYTWCRLLMLGVVELICFPSRLAAFLTSRK